MIYSLFGPGTDPSDQAMFRHIFLTHVKILATRLLDVMHVTRHFLCSSQAWSCASVSFHSDHVGRRSRCVA